MLNSFKYKLGLFDIEKVIKIKEIGFMNLSEIFLIWNLDEIIFIGILWLYFGILSEILIFLNNVLIFESFLCKVC